MEENANTSIDSKIIFLLETIHNNDFLGRLIFSLLTKGLKADNKKKTSHVLGTLACGHQVISFASRVHSGGCDGNSRILSGSMDDQDNERYSGLTQHSNILLTSLLILGNLCSLRTKAKSNVS